MMPWIAFLALAAPLNLAALSVNAAPVASGSVSESESEALAFSPSLSDRSVSSRSMSSRSVSSQSITQVRSASDQQFLADDRLSAAANTFRPSSSLQSPSKSKPQSERDLPFKSPLAQPTSQAAQQAPQATFQPTKQQTPSSSSSSSVPEPTTPPRPSTQRLYSTEVRPLPGSLDNVPVFNSNSPELVLQDGILLSTFPPYGRYYPEAHLDFAFEGRFDIFTHHISRARTASETRSLFQGILIENPTGYPVRLEVLQGASYLTRPDALFTNLPDYVDNPIGTAFSGPGSRTADFVLRGRRQSNWPAVTVLEPYESRMLMNLPIPAGVVTPTSNGRSTLFRLFSDGPLYVATMAMFAPQNPDGSERVPTLEEWQALLDRGSLAGPRDLTPTPLDRIYTASQAIYGRVAGVSQGSRWQASLTDSPNSNALSIPAAGRSFSYGISTLPRGELGTQQVQSAPMLRRYDDTAYLANGNYGIEYALSFPLVNNTNQWHTVSLMMHTPLKQSDNNAALTFLDPPDDRIFFRGTVRLRYRDDRGLLQTRYIHVTQRRGQQGEPLVTLEMSPGDRRLVEVDLIYPPDATPPQVITVQTEN